MAFFPHVDDVEQLKKLDGWLLNALFGAITLRKGQIRALGFPLYPSLSRKQLLAGDWYDDKKFPFSNDVRLPSFVRAWKYSKKALYRVELRYFSKGTIDEDEDLYR